MSTKYDQNAVSSMSSIIGSIDNDRQVYRWFLMLISLPEIRKSLLVNEKTKQEYQALKKIQITEIISYIALALMMTASYLTKQPWVLAGGVLPVAILLNLFQKNRQCVAAISEQFLLLNFQPGDLAHQTLFQTCEYISNKYNTTSLVDFITNEDFIGRKVLIGSLFFIPFIYPLKTWQLWSVIFALMLATIALVNFFIGRRKLK